MSVWTLRVRSHICYVSQRGRCKMNSAFLFLSSTFVSLYEGWSASIDAFTWCWMFSVTFIYFHTTVQFILVNIWCCRGALAVAWCVCTSRCSGKFGLEQLKIKWEFVTVLSPGGGCCWVRLPYAGRADKYFWSRGAYTCAIRISDGTCSAAKCTRWVRVYFYGHRRRRGSNECILTTIVTVTAV